MESEATTTEPSTEVAARLEQSMTQIQGTVYDEAKRLSVIKTAEDRAAAARFGVECAKREKDINAKADEVLGPIAESKRRIEEARKKFTAMRDQALHPVLKAKELLSAAISAFDTEQKRLARIAEEERQRKIREEREEYERKQREYEAEQKRLKDEEERKEKERLAEAQRQEDERKRKIKEEEDARIAHAQEAKAQGNTERVDAILEQKTAVAPALPPAPAPTPAPEPVKAVLPPPPAPPPPPPPAVSAALAGTESNGAVGSEVWKMKVTDPMALIKAVAEGKVALEHTIKSKGKTKKVTILNINEPLLRSLVRKLKNEFHCPGVEGYPEQKTSFYVEDAEEEIN